MRNIFLICLSTVFLSNICSAQSNVSWGVQVKGGSSISSYEPDSPGVSIQYLSSLGASIYTDIPVNRHLSFRPQVGFMGKGYGLTYPALVGTFSVIHEAGVDKFRFNYIPVDLTFVYKLQPGKAFHPFVQLGARGNVLVNSRIKSDSDGPFSGRGANFDGNNRLTIGGLIAVGVEWHRLAISFEANHDLNTYLGANALAADPDFKPTFRWYGFNLAYQLGGM